VLHGGRREGVEVVEVDNGDLAFAVLPTRGMNLWRGRYHDLPLGWQSPVQGPVHPKFVNLADRAGLGWLDGFDEWLCRCGLSSLGPPGHDPVTKENLPLHGRISNLPADYVEVRISPEPPYELRVIGQVEETCLFFGRLRLTSIVTTTPGSNRLVVQDVVENLGGRPAELELLYHTQVGPPFLEAGSRVRLPTQEVAPRDARAAEDAARWDQFAGPTPGFAEQVYFAVPQPDERGETIAVLHSAKAERGMVLRFRPEELPCFTLWKNTVAVEDGYVAGLEPGTSHPNFRATERALGRVRALPPGGRHVCTLTLEVLDQPLGVAAAVAEVERLQAQAAAVAHARPQAKFGG
jgi:hypothetical protein